MKYRGGMLPDQWPRSVQADIEAVKTAVQSVDSDVRQVQVDVNAVRAAVESAESTIVSIMNLLMGASTRAQVTTRTDVISTMHADLVALAADVEAVKAAVEGVRYEAWTIATMMAGATGQAFGENIVFINQIVQIEITSVTYLNKPWCRFLMSRGIAMADRNIYNRPYVLGSATAWTVKLAEFGVVGISPPVPTDLEPHERTPQPGSVLGLSGPRGRR